MAKTIQDLQDEIRKLSEEKKSLTKKTNETQAVLIENCNPSEQASFPRLCPECGFFDHTNESPVCPCGYNKSL